MDDRPYPRKGRGALSNPEGRFESRRVEATDDGWQVPGDVAEEFPPLPTTVTAERAKTILTRNDSPDVGFDVSINPYRGCEHGCVYCMSGETRVLLANGRTKALADMVVGDRICGTRRTGHYRALVRTTVLAHWATRKRAYRIVLAGGTQLKASGDHRFLTERGWKFVAQDGRIQRPHLTINDALLGIGIAAAPARLATATATAEFRPGWAQGYPSGLFDSEGSYGQGTLRIANSDSRLSIERKCSILGQRLKSTADLRIVSIVALPGEMDLFDITTGTGDFIANGTVSHNCYARPDHSYVNLSPGLDFETKLFYKDGAAELLETELRRKSYVCRPINIGASTDPYQPIERRLRVTRSLLDVLARFRHPVTIVTKSALIERDLDLLADLARDDLVNVFVSVTTLEPELKRTLEPRAPSPAARLRAVRNLRDSGVPVGVLVAPIIPAVNDSEIERIVEAVAAAGARTCGYVVLRLPWEVKNLFREWLDAHLPLRAAHVMALVNEMRAGKDNDPRFGTRMKGEGPIAELIRARFHAACRRSGLGRPGDMPLSTAHFRVPPADSPQLALW